MFNANKPEWYITDPKNIYEPNRTNTISLLGLRVMQTYILPHLRPLAIPSWGWVGGGGRGGGGGALPLEAELEKTTNEPTVLGCEM